MRGVLPGNRVPQGGKPLGRGRPCDVDVLFDRDGDAMQRSESGACGHGLVGGFRGVEGLVPEHHREGVDVRVHYVNAIKMGLHYLTTGDLPLSYRPRKVCGSQTP
jgi:hypothetical protein